MSFRLNPVLDAPTTPRFFSGSRDCPPTPPFVFPFLFAMFIFFILICGPGAGYASSSFSSFFCGASSSPTISYTILECFSLLFITSLRSRSSSAYRFISSSASAAASAAFSCSIRYYSCSSYSLNNCAYLAASASASFFFRFYSCLRFYHHSLPHLLQRFLLRFLLRQFLSCRSFRLWRFFLTWSASIILNPQYLIHEWLTVNI